MQSIVFRSMFITNNWLLFWASLTNFDQNIHYLDLSDLQILKVLGIILMYFKRLIIHNFNIFICCNNQTILKYKDQCKTLKILFMIASNNEYIIIMLMKYTKYLGLLNYKSLTKSNLFLIWLYYYNKYHNYRATKLRSVGGVTLTQYVWS